MPARPGAVAWADIVLSVSVCVFLRAMGRMIEVQMKMSMLARPDGKCLNAIEARHAPAYQLTDRDFCSGASCRQRDLLHDSLPVALHAARRAPFRRHESVDCFLCFGGV